MDWSHFGLARRPFWPAVHTASYFASSSHEAALAGIASAYARREPAALIHGEPGLGKSLLVRLWLERLPEDTPRVVLANLQATRAADLLQAILFDLNLPYLGLSEQELRLAVTEQLLTHAGHESPLVLVVDEAQNLGAAALEELRLLGNIESHGGSAVFALLASQTVPGNEHGFTQRLGAIATLESLSVDESAAYLAHQVKCAGGDLYELFDGEAISLLAGSCRGVPRLLNRAASVAAELACQGEAEQVDVEAVLEALSRLGLDEPEPETLVLKPRKRSRKAA